MRHIHVYGRKTTTITDPAYPGDPYSSDSTLTEWEIAGCGEVVPADLESFDSIETDLTERGYLLYVIFTTGDSSGIDERGIFEIIWVFKSLELAEMAKRKIIESSEAYKRALNHDYSFYERLLLEIDDGRRLMVKPPWNGYFENLDLVGIIEVEP